ncbi:uncharacterized protein LOC142766872 [Rhipicephalus microplus]|uniref:uncharacterized protein LOC142766872 n=1 Tax=Rhipicephalus microplus TaxID=6941 RepID=UPI003F6A5CAA
MERLLRMSTLIFSATFPFLLAVMHNDGRWCAHSAPPMRPGRPRPSCIPPGCFGGLVNALRGPCGPQQPPCPAQQAVRGQQPSGRPVPIPGLSPLSSPGSSSDSSVGSPVASPMPVVRQQVSTSPQGVPLPGPGRSPGPPSPSPPGGRVAAAVPLPGPGRSPGPPSPSPPGGRLAAAPGGRPRLGSLVLRDMWRRQPGLPGSDRG